MSSNEQFYRRLKEAYQDFKKEICFLLLILAVFVEVIPSAYFGTNPIMATGIQAALVMSLFLIVIGMLFDILERVKSNKKRITVIESTELLDNIYRLVKDENEITITYIAIAGATGWGNILSKFLDKNDKHALLNKKLTIDIALISERVLPVLGNSRYGSVTATVEEIEAAIEKIEKKEYGGAKVNVYRYDYMPNFIGYLINDNYLFSTISYWELEDGSDKSLALRGGRRSHVVYDKNDGFGGAYYIQRFKGWFDYIKSKDADGPKEQALRLASKL